MFEGSFRIALLIIGGIILLGLTVHWLLRNRGNKDELDYEVEDLINDDHVDAHGFNRDGVSAPRVVRPAYDDRIEPLQEPISALPEDSIASSADKQQKPVQEQLGFEQEENQSNEDLVIVVNLIAQPDKKITGEKLLHTLISQGFRYGEMQIFHRHEMASGAGKVLFSLANALNPGRFNIDTMVQEEFVGVTLFLSVSSVKKPLGTYEKMLAAAEMLADDLDMRITDEQRNSLTKQTIQLHKDQIIEFARKHLILTEL